MWSYQKPWSDRGVIYPSISKNLSVFAVELNHLVTKKVLRKFHRFDITKPSSYSTLPLTGAPSMISYFAIVSFSLYVLGPVPVVSLFIICISMCFILIRTSIKYILPTITSFKWYLKLRKKLDIKGASKKVHVGGSRTNTYKSVLGAEISNT